MLRIFILLTRRTFEFKQNPTLLLLAAEDSKYSAYYKAEEFNLKEIENINEFSRLFPAYLQMNSYIFLNYLLNEESYSFSIEPLFILKKHLMSNYEGFFLLENHNNDIIAWTESDVQITVLNEYNLFQRTNENPSQIKDEKILKNHTFGISVVLRHEKNSHQKKNQKNRYVNSPIYFCIDGGIESYIYQKDNNKCFGEDGIIVESFITKNRKIIISLAKDFIYGELLDINLFVDKNFNSLFSKAQNIINDNKGYFKDHSFENPEFEHPKKDEMKEFKDSNNQSQVDLMNIIKHGQVNIGCQFYTLNMVKDMISIARKKGRFEYLPTIIKKIDNELNNNKNNN